MVTIPYQDYGKLFDMVYRGEVDRNNLYYDGLVVKNFLRTKTPVHLIVTTDLGSRSSEWSYYIHIDRNDGKPQKYVYLGPESSIELDDEGEPLSKARINDPEIY